MTTKRVGKDIPFQRIRRITGYLVGSLEKWNDAKQAEEQDRVKHSVSHECRECERHKRMECPNSFLCYDTEDKPYFKQKHK